MAATILDGKKLAAQLRTATAVAAAEFHARHGAQPTLAAILVGDDPASAVYVRNKERACGQAGITSRVLRLPAATRADQLLQAIGQLNAEARVHGILVQLPLPGHIAPQPILDAIDPAKDVDAFHPENVGRLMQGRPRFLPCTPHGIVQLLHHSQIRVAGRHVVVVGRSDIVGKPLAMMLVQKDCALGPDAVNATVTICHSRTERLDDLTRSADILVAAVGRAHCITAAMIRPGAAVIDVGINRVGERLVGDVDYESALGVAGHLTPVPGGVGPLTIAMLLHNTLQAARLQVTDEPARGDGSADSFLA